MKTEKACPGGARTHWGLLGQRELCVVGCRGDSSITHVLEMFNPGKHLVGDEERGSFLSEVHGLWEHWVEIAVTRRVQLDA